MADALEDIAELQATKQVVAWAVQSSGKHGPDAWGVSPPSAKQMLAQNTAASLVNWGLRASGAGNASIATSFAGDIFAGYVTNPDRIKAGLANEGYNPKLVEKQLEEFKEYYAKEYKNGGLADVLASAASQAGGNIFTDEFARARQFEKFIKSGGSMDEFHNINKQMQDKGLGELDLPAYVKWSIEAKEEVGRMGTKGREEPSPEAKAAGVHDPESARKYLKEKLIHGGHAMQYNEVEKQLYGKELWLSQNELPQNPFGHLDLGGAGASLASAGVNHDATANPNTNAQANVRKELKQQAHGAGKQGSALC
jgi:hypothetical protein